jgi:hypothetical protein
MITSQLASTPLLLNSFSIDAIYTPIDEAKMADLTRMWIAAVAVSSACGAILCFVLITCFFSSGKNPLVTTTTTASKLNNGDDGGVVVWLGDVKLIKPKNQ